MAKATYRRELTIDETRLVIIAHRLELVHKR